MIEPFYHKLPLSMTILVKTFKTLKLAEKFQNKLYDQYNHVRLLRSPLFSECGTYTWEVK